VSLTFHAIVCFEADGGSYTYTSKAAADIAVGETFLVDPMQFRWERPQGAPAQPDPFECRFSLLVVGYVWVDIGARVSVRLLDAPGGDEIVAFHGRVTDCPSQPVDYYVDGTLCHGKYVDVTCVDPLVDLAEVDVTTAALPAQDPTDRLRSYENAVTTLPGFDPAEQNIIGQVYGLDSYVTFKAEDAGSGRALDRYLAVFDQAGLGIIPGGAAFFEPEPTALDRRLASRAILAARVDATSLPWTYPDSAAGEGNWFTIDEPSPYYTSATPADFPAVLTSTPDGYGLVMDDASPLVVPAGLVDFSAKFARNKFTHPNRATITITPTGSSNPVAVVVDSDDIGTGDALANIALDAPSLGDAWAAERMALMYLPENDARDRWVADAFQYYPTDWSRLLDGGSWFPRLHDVDLVSPGTMPGDPATRAECYTRPVVVSGINPEHNPTGRSWYAGELNGVTLTLDGDQPVVEFTLRRVLPVPSGAGAMTPADVPSTIKVQDLDDTFTVYDYRLARGSV
jgi:hypothetical protein